jgi:hypothetical protein
LTEELQPIVLEREQLDTIKLGGGRIFVLTAGMLTESTPAHDLAVRMMEDPRQAIFLSVTPIPTLPAGGSRIPSRANRFLFSAGAGK